MAYNHNSSIIYIYDYIYHYSHSRESCSVDISDAVFEKFNPCPKDLKKNLEVSYKCIPGTYYDKKLFSTYKVLVSCEP